MKTLVTSRCFNRYFISLKIMPPILVSIFAIFFFDTIIAQSKVDLFGFIKKDSVILISGIPPKQDEGINFYRKNSSGQFILLNTEGPVTPITGSREIIEIFGSNWKEVASTLSLNDPSDLVYLISEEPSNFLIMALKFPEIIKIAGCLYVDKSPERKEEAEYKIEIVDKNKSVKRTVTRKLRLRESQPPPLASLSAEIKDISVKLRWNYPVWKKDFSDFVTQFFVYRKSKDESFKKINTSVLLRSQYDSTLYFDQDVISGIEYTYYITAVDIIGTESVPSPNTKIVFYDKVPPSIPDEVKADTVENSIGISWKMNLELDAKGYNVFRSTKHDKEFAKLNSEIIPVEKSFFYDNNFEFGLQYFYRITCVDVNGNESEKSNAVTLVYEDIISPEPPTNFSYKLENKLIRMNWTASKSPDVAGYHFYRGESKDLMPRITSEAINGLTYVDSGITGKGFVPGGKYIIAITAYDNARNESEKVYSEDIFIPDDEPPLPPEGMITDITPGNYVEISCGGSSSPDVSIYKLFRMELEQTGNPLLLATYTNVPFLFKDTIIIKTRSYIYYTIAIDKAGNESERSRLDTIVIKDYNPPPSPRLVQARTTGEGIEITWEPVFDYDLAGYNIYKSNLPNGIYIKINKEISSELRFIDKEGKTTEYYKVKAVDTSGNESTKGDYATAN